MRHGFHLIELGPGPGDGHLAAPITKDHVAGVEACTWSSSAAAITTPKLERRFYPLLGQSGPRSSCENFLGVGCSRNTIPRTGALRILTQGKIA